MASAILLPPHPCREAQEVSKAQNQSPTYLRLNYLTPLTIEKQLLQSFQELSTLIQLLLKTLGHAAIHITGLQQLLKCLDHGAHVLTVNDTDVMAILNLLPLKGELPGLGLN